MVDGDFVACKGYLETLSCGVLGHEDTRAVVGIKRLLELYEQIE